MMQFRFDTVEEQDNWVKKSIEGFTFIQTASFEGYTVRENSVTALFERRTVESETELTDISYYKVLDYIQQCLHYWEIRVSFSKIVNAPIYLVIYKQNQEQFKLFDIKKYPKGFFVKDEKYFCNCEELANFFEKLKGMKPKKRFAENERLSVIDRCLRRQGIFWPGNLDVFCSTESELLFIGEYSRTRKNTVERHNLNDFFKNDINRWRALDILWKLTNKPLLIFIWSSEEEKLKILDVKRFNYSSNYIEYKAQIVFGEKELEQFIKKGVYAKSKLTENR